MTSANPQDIEAQTIGVIIVDHGSRRAQSNKMLETFVQEFSTTTDYKIVEPAHMELAEPSIATAFDRCVERGATQVLVCPYFLLPGKHWDQDIPALTQQAAERYPGVSFVVTAPIGLHPMMKEVIRGRIDRCMLQLSGKASECESCEGMGRCTFQTCD